MNDQMTAPIPDDAHYRAYLHHDTDGRALSVCTLEPASLAAALGLGWLMVEAPAGTDPSLVYVQDEAVVRRPESPASLSGMTLQTLPAPCQIQIGSDLYDCDEDHAELSFDAPGTFAVRVIAWPYLDKEFTVENPA